MAGDLFDSTSMQSAEGTDGRRKARQGPFLDVRQLDLFTAFVGDVPLRDDREAMSLPLCSLSKKKRITPIEWSNSEGTRWVKVIPTPEWGMATIWDLDVILWALSQLNEALERGMRIAPVIKFHPHDMLRSVGRSSGGTDYGRLRAALDRLEGTHIRTNVRSEDKRRTVAFGWLEGWAEEIDEKTSTCSAMSIMLPHWLFRAVESREVLAVSPAYFRITGGIERWLYRLARRHAGRQDGGWCFTCRQVWERSGSTRSLKQFAHDLRRIVEENRLPEYRLQMLVDHKGEPSILMNRDPARLPPTARQALEVDLVTKAEER
jgi:plasmid replication initiation protein